MARTGKPGRPRKPLPPRMRRAPGGEKAEALVRAVVDAAIAELAEHGHAGLTTNRVAERAGVSIGSLYQYFPNKEAIAAAVFERYLQMSSETFMRTIQSPDATYGELLDRVCTAFVDTYRAQPQIHRYLFELQGSASMHDRVAAVNAMMLEAITALMRRAGLTEQRAHDVAFVISHSFVGCCIAVFQQRIEDPRSVGQTFVAMARGYLRELGIDARPI
jgi:AcrR family transcriptional regulator